jgi:hypothetical protein
MAFHAKGPDGRRVKASRTFLLCVEADALADVVVALCAPDVEWHFEADDQDALVELAGAAAEGVGAGHLVDVGLAIVVGRIVLVERLHRRTRNVSSHRCRSLQNRPRRLFRNLNPNPPSYRGCVAKLFLAVTRSTMTEQDARVLIQQGAEAVHLFTLPHS